MVRLRFLAWHLRVLQYRLIVSSCGHTRFRSTKSQTFDTLRPLIEQRFSSMQEFVSSAVAHYAEQQLRARVATR
jgi:hypothetical protein